jgi:stress-induced morphogen
MQVIETIFKFNIWVMFHLKGGCMDRKERIEASLQKEFHPTELVVEDFSHQHSKGSESHIEVYIVAEAFDGCSVVKKHRLIYKALQTELDSGLHALKMQVFGVHEEAAQKTTPPRCGGGA